MPLGRGDGRILSSLGLTLSLSSPKLSRELDSPLYVIVATRQLPSPHPSLPITFCTASNPLSSLINKSFENICNNCSDASGTRKEIEVRERGWQHYVFSSKNLLDYRDFITIPSLESGESISVKHEIPRDRIEAAKVQIGEKYEVRLGRKCLGTIWWMFGELPRGKDVVVKGWDLEDEEEGEEDVEKGQNGKEKKSEGDNRVFWGEQPEELALVDEGVAVTFEVV